MRRIYHAGLQRRPRILGPAVSVYTTHRQEPLFDWFVDGLARQVDEADHVQLVMVDGLANDGRTATFEDTVADAGGLRRGEAHSVQRPIFLSGPHARSSRPQALRNTGIVYTAHTYVAFVDDCIVPMPGWWSAVREAARHQYVVAGAYQRHADMCVSNPFFGLAGCSHPDGTNTGRSETNAAWSPSRAASSTR